MAEQIEAGRVIEGPYCAHHKDTEILIRGRHGAIVRRYPNTPTGQLCANVDLGRLQDLYGKQRKRVEKAAPHILAALTLIVETAGYEHLQTIIGKEGVKQVRDAIARVED